MKDKRSRKTYIKMRRERNKQKAKKKYKHRRLQRKTFTAKGQRRK
jgi:hypothetical protein